MLLDSLAQPDRLFFIDNYQDGYEKNLVHKCPIQSLFYKSLLFGDVATEDSDLQLFNKLECIPVTVQQPYSMTSLNDV